MEGGVGVENDDVVNNNMNMNEVVRDTVHKALKGARGAYRARWPTEPLEGDPRSAERCDLD